MVHYLYHMYQLQRGQSFEQCPLKTHISRHVFLLYIKNNACHYIK